MNNKKRQGKKVLVGAITAAMITQAIPINVFAEDKKVETPTSNVQETKEKASNVEEVNTSKEKATNEDVSESKDSEKQTDNKILPKEDSSNVATEKAKEDNKVNKDSISDTGDTNKNSEKTMPKENTTPKDNSEVTDSNNKISDDKTNTDKTNPDKIESDTKLDTSAIVNIPDANLKAALNKILKQSVDSNITQNQLGSLEVLDLENSNIGNLDGLQYCKKANWINLNGNKANNLTPLEGLSSIQNLYLENNNISNLAPLSGLKTLEILDLSYNQITDIKPLSNLMNLNWLNLEYNDISDITSLKSLINLSNLDLSSNKVTDISTLSSLKNLTVIHLYDNPLTTIDPLKGMTNLTSVGLRDTGITNISDLATLPNLINLDLANNNISDLNPLKGLTKLQYLYLDLNKISNLKPISDLTNLITLSLNNNNISDVTPLKGLVNLKTLHAHNQVINLKEIVSHCTAEIDNIIKDENGNAIAPYSISNGGTYDAKTGKVIWDNINQNVVETYNFNKTLKIGDASGDFIGAVNQPILYVSDAKPVIDGAKDVTIKDGSHFDPLQGVTATDKEDGNLTKDIKVTGEVNTNKPGKYKLTYSVTDKDGNTVTVVRTVTVESAPVINAENKVVKEGQPFNPLDGVTATDKDGNNLTKDIKVIENTVDTNKVGTYKVTYEVTDKDGLTTKKTITVTVVESEKPVIDGATDTTTPEGKPFDPMDGVTATDKDGNDISKDINVSGNVNVNKPDSYKLTYSVTDKDGNSTTVERTITVVASSSPKTGDVGMIGYLGVGLSALGAMIFGKKKIKK